MKHLRRVVYRLDDWMMFGSGTIVLTCAFAALIIGSFYGLGWYLRSLGVPGIDIYIGFVALGQVAAFLAARSKRIPSRVPDVFKRPPGGGR